MFKQLKRGLALTLACLITFGSIPDITVHAEEAGDAAQVIEAVAAEAVSEEPALEPEDLTVAEAESDEADIVPANEEEVESDESVDSEVEAKTEDEELISDTDSENSSDEELESVLDEIPEERSEDEAEIEYESEEPASEPAEEEKLASEEEALMEESPAEVEEPVAVEVPDPLIGTTVTAYGDDSTNGYVIVKTYIAKADDAESIPEEEQSMDPKTGILYSYTYAVEDGYLVCYKAPVLPETAPLFSAIADDSLLSEAQLNSYDFSSKRLLVAGPESLILDPENVLSFYGGVYLMQHEDAVTARNAYSYYYGKAEFVDIDSVIRIASGENGAMRSEEMTAGQTPMDELAEAVAENPKKHAGTVIALIDTGVNEFDNVIEAVSMLGDDTSDANGHGTRMAQLIRKQNPNAKILSIKALGADGSGDLSAVYAAIEYAVSKKVDIINLSVSAPVTAENAALSAAVNEALSSGIKVVAAAGNKGRNAAYYTPANISGVIAVGACDKDGQRLASSNYGAAVNANVAAPTTSEAAAIYTGLLSANGFVAFDEQKVFPTNYEKPVPPAPEAPEEDPQEVKTHKLSVLSLSAGHVLLTVGEDQMKLFMDEAGNLSAEGVLKYKTEPVVKGSPYQAFIFDVKDKEMVSVKALPDEGMTFSALFVNDEPVYEDTLSFEMTEAAQITATYRTDAARFEAQANPTPDVANGATTSGTFTILSSYHTASNHENDIFCDRFMVTLHGGLLDGFTGVARCINPGVNAPLPGQHAVSYSATAAVVDDGTEKVTNWTITCYTAAGRQDMLISNYYYGTTRGTLLVKKESTVPGATVSNSLYNFDETTFVLYTDMYAAIDAASNGYANAVETKTITGGEEAVLFDHKFDVGSHVYVAEIRTNKNYFLNTQADQTVQWHDVEILSPDNPATLFGATIDVFKNEPKMNTLTIQKKSVPEGAVADLSGVIFRVTWIGAAYPDISFFEEDKDGNGTPEWIDDLGRNKPSKTWYFRTNSDGKVEFKSSYLFNGTVGGVTYTSDSFAWGTDRYGNTVNIEKIPYGSVYIYEEYCPQTLLKNPSTFKLGSGTEMTNRAFLQSDDRGMVAHATGTSVTNVIAENLAARGFMQVVKESENKDATKNNDCYDMRGIKFQIYTDAAAKNPVSGKVFEIKTYNAATSTGTSDTIELPVGQDFYLKEVKGTEVGTGYLYNENVHGPYQVASMHTNAAPLKASITEPAGLDPAGITIEKVLPDGTSAADWDMSGARFTLKYYAGDYTEETLPADADATWVIKPKKNAANIYLASLHDSFIVSGDGAKYGKAASGNYTLPYGTLTIQETTAPEGFEIDPKLYVFGISEDTSGMPKLNIQNATLPFGIDGFGFRLPNAPKRGGLSVQKEDADNGKTASGDADLSGIRFAVINNTGHTVTDKANKKYATGKVVTVLTTNKAGRAQTAADALPIGSYKVVELRADATVSADGTLTQGTSPLANNSYTWKKNEQTVTVEKNVVTPVPASFENEPIRGGVKLAKIDAEFLSNTPQGTATLEGAEITIYNNSKEAVYVNGQKIEPGQPVGAPLVTDAEGFAKTAADFLPYGTYYAKETKASYGYALNADWTGAFEIRENGVMVDLGGNPLPEPLARAELLFIKVDEHNQPMANIPFAVSRLDADGNPVETHVIVTDENGYASTADRAKDDTVNALDAFMSGARFTDDTALDATINIWFGEGTPAAGKGSLIAGDYLIEELQCEANRGQVMLKQTVKTDPFTDGHIYLAGNVFMDINITAASAFTDAATNSQSVTFGTAVELKDTVTFNNLKPGETYRVETEVFYKDRDGATTSVGTSESTFAAEDVSHTVANTLSVDTSAYISGKLHAADRLYMIWRGEEIFLASHNADLSEPSQTVYVPWMKTTASDTETGDHVGAAKDNASIADIVTYEGLADQKTYRVVGDIKDRETGKSVTDPVEQLLQIDYAAASVKKKGKTAVGPKDGELLMPAFVFNTKDLQGKTLVITETLYDDETGEVILVHEDLMDEEQTLHIPDVQTEAYDEKTNTRTAVAGKKVKITDKVSMSNLIPGLTYVVNGTLVYQEDFIDADGKEHKKGELIADHKPLEVLAESDTAVVYITFEVDASKLQGATGVVFEDVYHNGVKVASHHDFDAEEQTPRWPDLKTTAKDAETSDHVGRPRKETKIVDLVEMDNLIVGQKYTVYGVLMDQATNKPYIDADGKEVRPEPITFTAKQPKETKEMVFVFNGSNLEGTTVTVFEDLFHNDQTVAVHHDIESVPQSVHYPKIGTTATDAATKDHVAVVSKKAVIKDEVRFENLVPGQEYVMNGKIVIRGEEKTVLAKASLRFKPTEAAGFVTLTFEFDASGLDGKTVVAFEYVSLGDVEIARHEDPDDEGQSVHFPKVETTAKDLTTNEHQGYAGPTKIEDVVKLSNLIVGEVYDVSGVLMDKETRLPVLDADGNEIRAKREGILATASEMEVSLEFALDAKVVAGRTCVVFEDLYHNGLHVAGHADIDDEDQTVSYPSIRTTALDKETGTHVARKTGIVTVLDTVSYTNLKPGTYLMRGTLMAKATGQPMTDEAGRPLVTDLRFTVTEENRDGEVVLAFVFNTNRLVGSSVVVFERLFKVTGSGDEEELVPVADHEDLDDEGQTVSYYPPKSPKTGDDSNWKLWTLLLAIAAFGAAVSITALRRKRLSEV